MVHLGFLETPSSLQLKHTYHEHREHTLVVSTKPTASMYLRNTQKPKLLGGV